MFLYSCLGFISFLMHTVYLAYFGTCIYLKSPFLFLRESPSMSSFLLFFPFCMCWHSYLLNKVNPTFYQLYGVKRTHALHRFHAQHYA